MIGINAGRIYSKCIHCQQVALVVVRMEMRMLDNCFVAVGKNSSTQKDGASFVQYFGNAVKKMKHPMDKDGMYFLEWGVG